MPSSRILSWYLYVRESRPRKRRHKPHGNANHLGIQSQRNLPRALTPVRVPGGPSVLAYRQGLLLHTVRTAKSEREPGICQQVPAQQGAGRKPASPGNGANGGKWKCVWFVGGPAVHVSRCVCAETSKG